MFGNPVSHLWDKFFEKLVVFACVLPLKCHTFCSSEERDEQLSKDANLNYNKGAPLSSRENLLSCDDSFFLNCADSVPHEGCGRDDYHAWF
jgi:hypothetical protein